MAGTDSKIEDIRQHAKLCLKCKSWVFKHESNCPSCKSDNFTEDLNYFIKKSNTTLGVTIGVGCLGGILLLFLMPFTYGLSGCLGIILVALVPVIWRVYFQAFSLSVSHATKKSEEMERKFRAEFDRVEAETRQKVETHRLKQLSLIVKGIGELLSESSMNAKSILQEAIDEGANDPNAFAAYGLSLHLDGNTVEGLKFLEAARQELGPSYIDQALFGIYRRGGFLTPAGIRFFLQSNTPEELDVNSFLWLATELLRLGEAKKAKRLFQSLLNILPSDDNAQSLSLEIQMGYLASVYSLKEVPETEATSLILENIDKPPFVIIAKKIFAFHKIQTPEANEVFQHYWNLSKDDSDVYEALFNKAMSAKDFSSAMELANSVGEVLYQNIPVAYKTALLFMQQSEIDRGIKILQRVKKIPQWADSIPADQLQITLSRGYILRELLDLAMSTLLEIKDSDKKVKELYRLGQIAIQKGDRQTALQCFTNIYSEDADYLDVSNKIAELKGR